MAKTKQNNQKEVKKEVKQYKEDFTVTSVKTMFAFGLRKDKDNKIICLNKDATDNLQKKYVLQVVIPAPKDNESITSNFTSFIVKGDLLKNFKEKFGVSLYDFKKPFKPNFIIDEWYNETTGNHYSFTLRNLCVWNKEKKTWIYLYESNKKTDEQSQSTPSNFTKGEIDDEELPF